MPIVYLKDLLEPDEHIHAERALGGMSLRIDFRQLNVSMLSMIAPILINADCGGLCPAGAFSATAINLLTDRAIKKKLNLY